MGGEQQEQGEGEGWILEKEEEGEEKPRRADFCLLNRNRPHRQTPINDQTPRAYLSHASLASPRDCPLPSLSDRHHIQHAPKQTNASSRSATRPREPLTLSKPS